MALVAERNTALRMVFTDGQVTLDAGTGDDASANESVPCTLEARTSPWRSTRPTSPRAWP